MFYNPVYLRKTGRFGLIWLAATQSKILSKRELASINISTMCSDIYRHIPGLKGKGSRASRFSLYLCCQLMFGSVRVLQKQWDFLLVDLQMLSKRCSDNPSTTKDIDMATPRQAVCIDSQVPTDGKAAKVDPYFGAIKDSTVDVESMLAYLESLSETRMLRLEPFPLPVQPEIGSPHSVSDPKEIQIREEVALSQIAELHEEQELPKMDIESFLSMSQDQSFQEIQESLGIDVSERERSENLPPFDSQMIQTIEGQADRVMEPEDINVSMMREILKDALPQTDISMGHRGPLSPLEETPMTKPTSGMPAPPHKSKHDGPKKQRDPNKKGSRFKDICNGTVQPDPSQPVAPATQQTSSDDSFPLRQQQKEREKEREATERGHGHDWAQKNSPLLDLHPVAPTQSPLRKKRPHKLVIDQCLMMSRAELKQNMKDTSDILIPLELPDTTKARNIYREPALGHLKRKAFVDLFTKNCKFGLKTDDTGSEPDSLPSPRLADFISRKRARKVVDDAETPANKIPRNSRSEVASMEKARDDAANRLSESLDRNLSHSRVEEELLQGRSSTSMRGHLSFPSDNDTSKEGSILERDITFHLGGPLTTWPEEKELKPISPIRHVSDAAGHNVEGVAQSSVIDGQLDVTVPEISLQQESIAVTGTAAEGPVVMDLSDTPRTTVSKLVENNLRSSNDWTTFCAICPPTSYTRKVAASMFNALLAQIARGKLCARQDEPYTSIFIWIPDHACTSSGTSMSSEV